ncbi:MAG: retroviral-like aspartic protease family protein [Candidatus Hermodarchaeota archaeon]|nr:retroviral-like aspartic protease family protein [Candidatus Hermodarchaeota archaeon]
MEIKFKLDKETHHIHVPVYVNGEGPFDFTLDTGAVKTTLSKTLAKKLDLKTYELMDRKMEGLPAVAAKVNSLQIGSDTFDDEEVLIIDFKSVLPTCTDKMGGVIGHTTLKHYKMSINYSTQTLRLEPSNGHGSTKDDAIPWSPFNYIKDTHMIGIHVTINGQGPFEFVLDTGAGGTVITPELANKLNLDLNPFDGICRGIGGDAEGHFATLDQLSVGGVNVEEHPVIVINMEKISPKCHLIPDGILGYPFLQQFEFVIDYPHEKFAFIDHGHTTIDSVGTSRCCE